MTLFRGVWSALFCFLLALDAFAGETIKITVHSNEKNVVAIGFTVNGLNYGSLGNSYSTRGPKNKTYLFGIRKDSIFGESVSCGSLSLEKDSSITLVYQDNLCVSILD
ncbi:hypothetical protein Lwal_0629 [Legionella waltersii]|uniref:Secreted protein n=2 Tax=Legionella waltersii TaxID=66969 RepID=A0A0W1AMM1_9GAMM|nr:hypothetical protein Lwal_0629 [Legionella waltersii]SNV02982.1 Uncharacterised protein [Legionella waltersii]